MESREEVRITFQKRKLFFESTCRVQRNEHRIYSVRAIDCSFAGLTKKSASYDTRNKVGVIIYGSYSEIVDLVGTFKAEQNNILIDNITSVVGIPITIAAQKIKRQTCETVYIV